MPQEYFLDEAFNDPSHNPSLREFEAIEDEEEGTCVSEDEEASENTEDEGRLRNKIYREAMRLSIVNSVRRNCLSLIEVAEKKVAEIHGMAILENLAIDIYAETDETRIGRLLDEAVFNAKEYIHSDPDNPHQDKIITRLNLFRYEELQKIKVLQHVAVSIVEVRFPNLVELAKEQLELVDHLKVLETILPQLAVPSDENRVRKILNMLPGYRVNWD
jgi:hypothetical protein